ncbi:ribulokinase [Siminovitchia acidinfaciens]|uniref:Ribulokinase n=1 Tax=Siminovitchia acidinfaciens TaxID=2321395 RepID=A0A429XWL3_9BACI|nr:ribulokinase [Siminovitchia acidinfaciens]RST72775.1 ribulokinase [Siminovitchia acidinfaciens]
MKYSIGIDFGTGSGRVLIVNVQTGEIAGMSVVKYSSGTIEKALFDNMIPDSFALQDSADYIDVLQKGIPAALADAGINKEDIIGMGIDFTSSTMVVTDETFTPLSWYENYKTNPHAYVKLWKHHGASEETAAILETSQKQKEKWLGNYGLNVSSEWMIPKILELKNKAPEILKKTAYIMEAGDWIVSRLVHENVRSNCARGFKSFWNEQDGFYYDFFEQIDPDLPTIVKEKLEGRLVKIGEKAGVLTREMSESLGLPEGLPVAAAIIDAHSSLLGIGSRQRNQLTMVMGTSTCHLMLHEDQKKVPGISGSVKDAIIPGLFAYEAGQSAVGDLFEFAVKQAPKEYIDEAKERNISVYKLLEQKAAGKKPGEAGLVALDWHNGNRSLLSNSGLRALLIGQTLHTKHEDIYRAYMEATAFGTKMIMSAYEEAGMDVEEVFACGGLPQKSPLLMRIYADILNKPIYISATDYAPAVGAAILGAVAGKTYDSIEDAVAGMEQPFLKTVHPIPENVEIYKKLFAIYKDMHDYFGKQNTHIMEELNKLSYL